MQDYWMSKMPEHVYECDNEEYPALKKVLEYDPYLDKTLDDDALKKLAGDKYANTIFARQEYSVRDGLSVSLDKNKYYLYLKANEDFLKLAEERFSKEFKTVKRSGKESEDKIIAIIHDEESRANQGFGAIFGG